jgi:hypothetical protein
VAFSFLVDRHKSFLQCARHVFYLARVDPAPKFRQHRSDSELAIVELLFDRAQEARHRPFHKWQDPLGSNQQLALCRVRLEAVKAACT